MNFLAVLFVFCGAFAGATVTWIETADIAISCHSSGCLIPDTNFDCTVNTNGQCTWTDVDTSKDMCGQWNECGAFWCDANDLCWARAWVNGGQGSASVGHGYTTSYEKVVTLECADGTDTCDANAICTDSTAGYSCECKTGYIGDGFTCAQDPNIWTAIGFGFCRDDNGEGVGMGLDEYGLTKNECKAGCIEISKSTPDCTAISFQESDGHCVFYTTYSYTTTHTPSPHGFTCYTYEKDPYTRYPGYAANWDNSPGAPFQPLRLYDADRSDLTASLAACEAECQGDTGCYAVEWRSNEECRLFDYKPIVYLYTDDWTVSVQIRTFVPLYSDCGEYCGNGGVDTDTGRTFTGNDYNYVPIYFKPCSTGSADEGWTCEPSQDFGGNVGKTGGGFSDKAGGVFDKPAGFNDNKGGFDDYTGFNNKGGFNTTFVRWGAGIGLGVVAVFLGVKLVRRRRSYDAVSFV